MIILWILPLSFCGISCQYDSSGVELDCTWKLECLCISVYNSITKSWYTDQLGQKFSKDYLNSLVKSKEIYVVHPLIKITFEAESFIFTSFYSISDGVTLQVTLLCHTTVVLFPVYARKNFWEGTNLAANLALFSNPALQMQYFQWGVQGWINF